MPVRNLKTVKVVYLVNYITFERIRGAFCDDALYKLTFTLGGWSVGLEFPARQLAESD